MHLPIEHILLLLAVPSLLAALAIVTLGRVRGKQAAQDEVAALESTAG
jgi:hypothetical protein